MSPSMIAVSAGLALLAAGANPAAHRTHDTRAPHALVGLQGANASPTAGSSDDCTFSQGTTTCIFTYQYTEKITHLETSGCLYGPYGIPGRRTRTIEETYLVTVTVASYIHGKSGAPYDVESASTRDFISRVTISDVCEVL
jgi:hypothetical protein